MSRGFEIATHLPICLQRRFVCFHYKIMMFLRIWKFKDRILRTTYLQKLLINKGIKILPFDANNIKEDMVVIQGNAFASSHEEIVRAHQLKLDVRSYNDFLGQIIDQYNSQ